LLDLQHHLFRLTFEALHVAPLPKSLHHVLDIGTGTGVWAIEFGMPTTKLLDHFPFPSSITIIS
jgi:ubiquinone/menaquinone biosynthesis C-methylase UbiE